MADTFENLQSPESLLTLASAIVQREMQEQAIMQQSAASVLPAEQLPVEIQTAMSTARTTLLLKALDQPEALISADEVVGSILDEKFMDLLMQSADESFDEAEKLMAKEFIGNMLRTVLGNMQADGSELVEMSWQLTSAKEVAEQYGVSVSTVFEDDELYLECVRNGITVEGYIDNIFLDSQKFTMESYAGLIKAFVKSAIEAEGKMEGDDVETIQREIDQTFSEMENDPDFQATIAATTGVARDGLHQAVIARIKRVWGLSITDLSDDAQMKVNSIQGGDYRLTKDVVDEIASRKKKDTAMKLYCITAGWDYRSLTIEQMKEISKLPEWQEDQNTPEPPSVRETLEKLTIEQEPEQSPMDKAIHNYCQSQGWDAENLRLDQRLEIRGHLRDLGFKL